ncbi:MAG: hypothetical protein HY246_02310 [Proteobacteria bacterium]|nr:hypothetical protein [Pseudomonadota bacterium]
MRRNPRSERAKGRKGQEPTLAELLDDPIIQAVMARDGVERAKLDDLIAAVQARLRRAAREHAAAD